jgi:superfamily I DNA/RNA helicase
VGEADDAAAESAATYPALVAAVAAWTIREGSLPAVTSAVDRTRERLQRLSRDDARLTLATAHATKGLEFDDVVVIGMTAGRFPSARSVSDAADPRRALEEERRLAYVAWTRARRSLTLVYEAADPSPFLLEAFDPGELAGAPLHGTTPGRGSPASGADARERRRTPV